MLLLTVALLIVYFTLYYLLILHTYIVL